MRWLASGTAALILAGLILAGLILGTACSGSPASNSTATTIDFWYVPSGAQPDQYFQDAAKSFHAQHPDIEVKGTKIAPGDAYTKMRSALTGAGAGGPDVMQVDMSWVGAFAATGAMREFTADDVQNLGGSTAFVPAAWSTSAAFNTGKITAIPWFIDTRAIYYRTDILKQVGIDPADGFKDWEALDHTLEAIRASGKIAPLGIPGKNDASVVASFAPWIWEAGGSLLSDDGTRPTINQPAAVDGVDEYQRFGGKYVDPGVLQRTNTEVESMFAAGKFAVTIAGPSLALKLQGQQIGVQQFPNGHAGHVVYLGGSDLAIRKSSPRATQAYEWVRWLVSSAGQTTYVKKTGMYPALVAAAPEGAFKSQMSLGRTFPTLAAWPALEKVMATNLANIWNGVASGKQPMPKDALETILKNTATDMQTALGQP